jgi:hypothetical protein
MSSKDSSQLHASLHPLQELVEPVLLHHERKGAFDGFGLRFGTQHGLRARQLRVIELEMFVSSRGALPHGLSPLDYDDSLHAGC